MSKKSGLLSSSRDVTRVLVLRDNAFEPELASVLEHGRAIRLDMLIQPQTRYRTPEQAREHLRPKQARELRLAHHERLTPQIISIQLDQIESVEKDGFIVR
jgi:hypothetical protein